MRLRAPSLVAVAALVAPAVLAACGEDTPPVAVNVGWQIQCATPTNCPRVGDREIRGFDGEGGLDVTCSGVEDDFGNVVLEFSARDRGAGDGFAVAGLGVNPESLSIIAEDACRMDVLAENDYRGGCGSGAPTEGRPCQIRVTRLSGGEVEGFLRCDGIPLRASAASRIRLLGEGVTYNPAVDVNGQGASFAFKFCDY